MTIGSGQWGSYSLEASVPYLKEIMLATAPWQFCTIFLRVYGFRKIILCILFNTMTALSKYPEEDPLQISGRQS
jgi:hypothetical protein